MDALLEEFDGHSFDPSHIIADGLTERTGVEVSSRRVREIRHKRGRRGSQTQSSRDASPSCSPVRLAIRRNLHLDKRRLPRRLRKKLPWRRGNESLLRTDVHNVRQ